MAQIAVTITNGKMMVVSPYNPDFPGAARRLGGKWSAHDKTWIFDARDEQRVRALCMNVYGSDGQAALKTVTMKCRATRDESASAAPIYVAGRMVAAARGRDTGAILGDGVVIISGMFDSGGSMKNWKTTMSAGTEFEIRDVPEEIAMREIEGNIYGLEISVIEDIQDDELPRLMAERDEISARLEKLNDRIAHLQRLGV